MNRFDLENKLVCINQEIAPAELFLEYAWGKPKLMLKDKTGITPVTDTMKKIDMDNYLTAFWKGVRKGR